MQGLHRVLGWAQYLRLKYFQGVRTSKGMEKTKSLLDLLVRLRTYKALDKDTEKNTLNLEPLLQSDSTVIIILLVSFPLL